MSLTFGFYNSVNGDRRYNALQMSSIFDGIIKDGIFMSIGDCFVVSEYQGMVVHVGTGRAWFDHSWTYNDSILPITIPVADILYNRIDSVVLDINSDDLIRANSIVVVQGTPSANPVPPTLIKETEHSQYLICNIYVGQGVTSITQANITNFVGTEATPFISGLLETVNTSDLLLQWAAEWEDWKDAIEADNTTWTTTERAEFDTWFATVQDIINDTALATHLSDTTNPHNVTAEQVGAPTLDENGKVPLANLPGPDIKGGSSSFSGSGGATPTVITDADVTVNTKIFVMPTGNPNGAIGEIWVVKHAGSFDVYNSGTATTTFDWIRA